MLVGITRIALVFTALGLGTSEWDGAMAETTDSDRANRLGGTDGSFAEFAPLANRRPVVNRRIRNRRAQEGTGYSFRIPGNIFTDPDGDRLSIRAQESVDWLSFNQQTRTLSGMPLAFDNPAAVRVRATDPGGKSVATTFRVRIRPLTVDDDAPPGQSTPSRNIDGTEDSFDPAISANGRFVAHVFERFNQDTRVPEQSIVVRDFTSASFSGRGSWAAAGPRSFEPGDSSAALFSSPSISGDGRLVAFVAQTAPEANSQGVEIRVLRIADSDPLNLQTKFVRSILRSDDAEARRDLVESTDVSLSADGRIVAFEQGTGIAVAKIGTRRRLMISDASSPSISRNGRRIAYEEVTGFDERAILVATLDIDGMRVIDTTVVGVDIDSEFGPLPSNPVVSLDGTFVAFESDARNLVAGDTNGARDIFVFKVREQTVSRVSVDADGDQADGDSSHPSLSKNRRRVAFDMAVPGLDEFGERIDVGQVLVRELDPQGEPRGELSIASVNSDGVPADGLGFGVGSSSPSLSGEGHLVTFQSTSTNLTPDARENQGTAVFLAPTFPDYAPVVDLPFDPRDNIGTPAMLVLDAPRRGEIDPTFDADWCRVELIGGQAYRFELQADSSNGTPLGDPFLELRDASGGDPGGVPTFDDDSGGGLNDLDAQLDFLAPSSGTFFVVARGFNDETGDYVLSVVTPPPATTASR